jgi:hypothetical protein
METAPEDPWRVSWETIHARAWWSLNHSARLPPSVSRGKSFHGLPRLRLWDDALDFGRTAEPNTLTVFELFADGDGRVPVVREAVWNRSADLTRTHQAVRQSDSPVVFKPTISVRDAVVPAERLAALLQEASAFRVPVVWSGDVEAVTSDVGGRGLEFFSRDQPPAALRLEWSYDTPPEWEPVLEWCGRLRQFLEDCLPTTAGPAEQGGTAERPDE